MLAFEGVGGLLLAMAYEEPTHSYASSAGLQVLKVCALRLLVLKGHAAF